MDIRKVNVPDPVAVEPQDNMMLKVFFEDGTVKLHDVKLYLKKFKVFEQLLNEELFKSAYVDGYGIAWNDDIDLSIYDVWELGQTVS